MDSDKEEFDEDEYFFAVCLKNIYIQFPMYRVMSITRDHGRNKHTHAIIFGESYNLCGLS